MTIPDPPSDPMAEAERAFLERLRFYYTPYREREAEEALRVVLNAARRYAAKRALAVVLEVCCTDERGETHDCLDCPYTRNCPGRPRREALEKEAGGG